VAEYLGVLQKLPRRDHLFKFFAGGKVVLAPVLLRATRKPRRPGNREIDAGQLFADFVDQRAFSRARRSRNDEKYPCHDYMPPSLPNVCIRCADLPDRTPD